MILFRLPQVFRAACLATAAWAVCGLAMPSVAAQASTPSPEASAVQPDARDFLARSDTSLLAQGNVQRFGGVNVSWLGLRSDTGSPRDGRIPTQFEVADALRTAQVMGAGTLRAVSLLASAGCVMCLAPAPGQINPVAQSAVDHVLRMARDAGLKIVLPLAGSGQCAAGGAVDPVEGTPCVFARARHLADAAFYSDPHVRDDFAKHVVALLNHINPETGLAWKDDPTIMAWENCDACGAGVDDGVMADWTEFLGRTIKAIDAHHLYENGGFAGRIVRQGGTVDAAKLALPSVDIVGDRLAPPAGTPPAYFGPAQQAVTRAGRIYLVDSYAWAPAHWASVGDLEAFLTELERDRAVAGAFVNDLGAHADQGGWLAPTRPGAQTLYFPAAPSDTLTVEAMLPRARAVRRLSYAMMDLPPLAFALPFAPEIISANHGKVTWRGGAGAVTYSIQRSGDLTATGSWATPCYRCVTDSSAGWQDNAVPAGDIWYRIVPFNSNDHLGRPSDPVKNQ